MEEAVKKVAKKTVKKKADSKIKMRSSKKFLTHHFQCSVEKMRQDIGWTGTPVWKWIDHMHFAHTKDSSGRTQKYTTKINGHCHELEWEMVDGEPVARIGRAFKEYKGKYYDMPEEQQHTHTCEYFGTDELESK